MHTSNASNVNNKSPSHESKKGTENLTPVNEYEDMRNQMELTDEKFRHSISQNGEKCNKR